MDGRKRIEIIRMIKDFIRDSDKESKKEIVALLNDLIKDSSCQRCGGAKADKGCSAYGKSYSTHLA